MRGRWALSGMPDDSLPPAERPPGDLIVPWSIIEPDLYKPDKSNPELDEVPEGWEEIDAPAAKGKLNLRSVIGRYNGVKPRQGGSYPCPKY
jgi:hypothetical protein